MRFSRLMLAASGLATVALLGSSVAANAAATINGPFYNPGEAGYQVQSSVNFNEVRTTVHVDPGSSTSPFIALQSTVNGGATAIIGLENIGGNYFLYGATDVQLNVAAGVPLPAAVIAPQLQPLSSIGAPAGTPLFNSQSGGSFFIEVHYSTKHNLVQFVAGPSETNEATLAVGHVFTESQQFHAPSIETLNFGGGSLPISTPQVSFTRSGLTEPSGENIHTVGGQRITFDAFPLNEAVATTHGGAPTITHNPITLEPSPALPGVGSAFGIVTGPQA
jgi:hypothetical protein